VVKIPYIKQEDRAKYKDILNDLNQVDIKTGGELNYLFCKIAFIYLGKRGESYQTWSDIHSALTLADAELRHRFLNNYERSKQLLNGDII